jgi:hypothetical protein
MDFILRFETFEGGKQPKQRSTSSPCCGSANE